MIGINEFKRGIMIELDGELYQVIDFQHVKMKRTAIAKVKLRDVRAGHTTERTFQNTEKFVRARLEYRNMQYLYQDGELYYFMDQENFEQIPLNKTQLGNALDYIKEGMSLQVADYNGEVIGVELPITVELEVTVADPGYKGDTATGGTKPATLETGVTITVPLFVNTGDVIKVDTRNGTYLERI